jgi:hypothetical protein
VVILQLTQYVRYRRLAQSPNERLLISDAAAEAVGFCTGLLSALAVSCSTTQQQLEQHGASAVRLALLIGAFVEIHNASEAFVTISACWQFPEGKKELTSILEAFPEVRFAYHDAYSPYNSRISPRLHCAGVYFSDL